MCGGAKVVVLILALMFSGIGGWVLAHNTVAAECEKLGGFYVGNSIYSCRKVQD